MNSWSSHSHLDKENSRKIPSFLTLLGKTSYQINTMVWYLQGILAKCSYLQSVTGTRSVIQNNNTFLILPFKKIFFNYSNHEASTVNNSTDTNHLIPPTFAWILCSLPSPPLQSVHIPGACERSLFHCHHWTQSLQQRLWVKKTPVIKGQFTDNSINSPA